ncbi:hypothetical protein FOA52_013906 [Chlamydomonas sp. UWO 241]|nr:hypothetical protein FOA52_013906 [Chlamydomonas sp. UWO 241]
MHSDSIGNLKAAVYTALDVPDDAHDRYELVDYYGQTLHDTLANNDQTLLEANLLADQDILVRDKTQALPADVISPPPIEIEASSSDGKDTIEALEIGPLAPSPSNALVIVHSPTGPLDRSRGPLHNHPFRATNKNKWGSGTIEDSVTSGSNTTPGLVGLSNLGNTCYMNSSLQCLLHTVPLMRCFLSGAHEPDVNMTNPLGQKGELAQSFASLMGSLWQPGVSYVTPRSFKAKIGRFCHVFSGYGQQDSQELITFLLDGLHEDLNRIREKPYIPEDKGEDLLPDDELAAKHWGSHLARNDSLVVDHCLGLYRSKLVCPRCSHVSRKFDPVMYLSLPLPESKSRTFKVMIMYADGSQAPLRVAVEVASVGTVKDLLYAVAKVGSIPVSAPPAYSRAPSSAALSALAASSASGPGSSRHPSSNDGAAASSAAGGASGGGGGPPPPPLAHEVMLLAKISQAVWQESVELFDDPKTRVSEVSANDKSYNPEFLVCYVYPSAAAGPANKELHKVWLHHRHHKNGVHYGGKIFGAPMLMLMPEDIARIGPELLSAKRGGYSVEYTVSRRAPIMAAIHAALTPFRTGDEADGEEEDEAGAAGVAVAADAEAGGLGGGWAQGVDEYGLLGGSDQDGGGGDDVINPGWTAFTGGDTADAGDASGGGGAIVLGGGAGAGADGGDGSFTPSWMSLVARAIDLGAATVSDGTGAGAGGAGDGGAGADGDAIALEGDAAGGDGAGAFDPLGITVVAKSNYAAGCAGGDAGGGAADSGGGGGAAAPGGGAGTFASNWMSLVARANDVGNDAVLTAPEGDAAGAAAAAATAGAATETADPGAGGAGDDAMALGSDGAGPGTPQQQEAGGAAAAAGGGDGDAMALGSDGAAPGTPQPVGDFPTQQQQQPRGSGEAGERAGPGAREWAAAAGAGVWAAALALGATLASVVPSDAAAGAAPDANGGDAAAAASGAAASAAADAAPGADGAGAAVMDWAPHGSDTPAPGGPGATAPFDMWAGQRVVTSADADGGADAPPPGDAAAGGSSGGGEARAQRRQPQFVLRVSKEGRTDSGLMRDAAGDDVVFTRTFIADWPEDAVPGPYDPATVDDPREHESYATAESASQKGRAPVSLNACFDAFLQPEQLSEDDSWYCPKCKDHVEADKKLDLWHLPEVLVVHLKRFCYTRTQREKITTRVDFPLEGLDLSGHLMRPQGVSPIYDCYAVSNHFGSLGGGHYTAFCKMPSSDKWYCFDDSSVSEASESDVTSSAAYVLFYRRRTDAQADPPDMVDSLIAQHAARATAVAAAAAEAAEEARGAAGARGGHFNGASGSGGGGGDGWVGDGDRWIFSGGEADSLLPPGEPLEATSGGGGARGGGRGRGLGRGGGGGGGDSSSSSGADCDAATGGVGGRRHSRGKGSGGRSGDARAASPAARLMSVDGEDDGGGGFIAADCMEGVAGSGVVVGGGDGDDGLGEDGEAVDIGLDDDASSGGGRGARGSSPALELMSTSP